MTRRRFATLALLAGMAMWPAAAGAQEVTLEYSVKAAYLYNFVKFVEWPGPVQADRPLTICVAAHNPFGSVLSETVQGERVGDRPIALRVILEPEPGCDVLFLPRDAAAPAYLRAVQSLPVLTVGETGDFIEKGGIINFVREGGNIRFEIDQDAAQHAGLRISSRLLRLGRVPNRGGR